MAAIDHRLALDTGSRASRKAGMTSPPIHPQVQRISWQTRRPASMRQDARTKRQMRQL
jgi:hypothetical protein